VEQG
jgi:hypothetical protein